MTAQYEVIIADDPEHEELFAEIQLGGKFIALISQEDGTDRLVVELPGLHLDEEWVLRRVPLKEFMLWLELAANRLVGDNLTDPASAYSQMGMKHGVVITNDTRHGHVFADVHFNDKLVAYIFREDGFDHLDVEIPGPDWDENQVLRQVPLMDFIIALREAIKELMSQLAESNNQNTKQ